eukprot:UN0789
MYRVDRLEDSNVQDLSPLSQRVLFRSESSLAACLFFLFTNLVLRGCLAYDLDSCLVSGCTRLVPTDRILARAAFAAAVYKRCRQDAAGDGRSYRAGIACSATPNERDACRHVLKTNRTTGWEAHL